jgi:hypothetical protein
MQKTDNANTMYDCLMHTLDVPSLASALAWKYIAYNFAPTRIGMMS